MFAAVVDTTSTTVEWAMAELMRHLGKMKRAQDEVRGVMGDKPKIDESDVNEMRYLKCVVKETLRLHPPGPLLAPRKTISDVKLGGYDIPSKTKLVNGWAIHRDPKSTGRELKSLFQRDLRTARLISKTSIFSLYRLDLEEECVLDSHLALLQLNIHMHWFDWKLPAGTDKDDMSEASGQGVSKKIPLVLQPIPR